MKVNSKGKHIITRIALFMGLCLLIAFLWYSEYKSKKADEIVLKSRYTYSVSIDSLGNVVADENEDRDKKQFEREEASDISEFTSLSLSDIARIWTESFTGQFTAKYVPWSKALRKVKVNQPTVLNASENTVLVSFSAEQLDATSEYFSSWNGVTDNDRLKCEWVITFELDNHNDGTATIYVSSVMSPEDYGIAQYNSQLKSNVSAEKETASGNSLTNYEIKNQILSVTYNSGTKYITVPVDVENLMYEENSTTQLKEGSYQITSYKTAFLYGGKTDSGNKKTPVTLIYSNDSGVSWITCEIEQIYDADYCYVNFFDENKGVIVIGYGKNNDSEASRIYTTSDGGENWTTTGSGPATNIIKGVKYIDENVGFFCYSYMQGMDSNLYMTRDGSKTFAKVIFEAQELDSTAANSQTQAADTQTDNSTTVSNEEDTTAAKLEWKDVYKEATVPIVDNQGNIVVYLTQGNNGVYNSGKTAAKYQSSDEGQTWKYIGQLEITTTK